MTGRTLVLPRGEAKTKDEIRRDAEKILKVGHTYHKQQFEKDMDKWQELIYERPYPNFAMFTNRHGNTTCMLWADVYNNLYL